MSLCQQPEERQHDNSYSPNNSAISFVQYYEKINFGPHKVRIIEIYIQIYITAPTPTLLIVGLSFVLFFGECL